MSLLIFFLVYFAFAFVARAIIVYRRTDTNPLVFPSGDDAQSYVGRAFKVLLLAMGILLTVNAFSPGVLLEIGGLEELRSDGLRYVGWGLLILSALWLVIAQAQMGNSWRIGIDTVNSTMLVSRGLFSISRNPIFLSFRVSLLGLLMILPNAATLAVLVAGELIMQMQVRLEEEHLRRLHGDIYLAYQAKVRRWL